MSDNDNAIAPARLLVDSAPPRLDCVDDCRDCPYFLRLDICPTGEYLRAVDAVRGL